MTLLMQLKHLEVIFKAETVHKCILKIMAADQLVVWFVKYRVIFPTSQDNKFKYQNAFQFIVKADKRRREI